MDETVFPPEHLAALYTHGEFEGLPTRELRKFELVDGEGRYVQLSNKKGAISLVAELAPTTAGKKENADVKPVVVLLPEVLEFRLRGDASKFSNFYFWARTGRAWYCLKTPHPEFAEWWKEQAAQMALMPLVEREVAAKNPRSFERIIARLCKEVPGQKVDVTDFVDRYAAFILKQFETVQGSEFLEEMRKQAQARGGSRAVWPLPGNVDRLREVNRDCNKGNEWACQLLGLPLPERVTGKGGGGGGGEKGGKRKRAKAAAEGGEEGGAAGTSPSAAVAKKASHGVEDMSLPGADTASKMQFKRLICPIPHTHLLDLFTVTEFVGAFGPLVLGQESILAPSQLIEWVTSQGVPNEYQMLFRELMHFIGNEGKDPSVRGFGGVASENDLVEEELVQQGQGHDEVPLSSPIPPLGRLRKLVSFLGEMTWCEVLRRMLYTFRLELAPDLLREVTTALDRWDFGGLPSTRKLEVTAFLVRKCLQCKRVHDAVEETQTNVTRLKAEKTKALKEVRAKYTTLLKTPLPPTPESTPELTALLAQVATREAAQEQLRAEGTSDRSELARAGRELAKLRHQAEDLKEELQGKYDEVALAPARRDEELARVAEEYDPRICEERAMMRIDPLGQDRYRRTFWHFDLSRDTHDIVLVQDSTEGRWTMIDSADDLEKVRSQLNIRGMREKRLRAGIDLALPRLRRFAEEEAEILSNPRKKRDARTALFGRVAPKAEDDDEEEAGKKGDVEGATLDEEAQLSKLQTHLIKAMQELPTGCVKPKDLERLSGQVDKTKSGRELAEVLKQLEEAVAAGWLGRTWTKERQQWVDACDGEEVSYPLFALLLYMLEFSVDRYYNPDTGKSERPAANKHKNICSVCDKAGQLLCCDNCPRVYHMYCLDPPLHHIPRGAWSCPHCSQRARGGRNPTRSTRAEISYDETGLALRNPTRSTRKAVDYKGVDDDDNDDGDENEDEEERPKAKPRRSKRGKGEESDSDEEEEEEKEKKKRPGRRGRPTSKRSKKESEDDEDEDDEDEDEDEDEAEAMELEDDDSDNGDDSSGGDDDDE